MFLRHTKRKGFTVMEMLVSIGILVVIVGIVLANFKQGTKKDSLRLAASQVSSVSRKAQSLSLIGSEQNLPDLPVEVLSSSGIFGIHFDLNRNTEYLLFLDFKDDEGENVPDGIYQSGEELPNFIYDLPKGIVFESLDPITGDVLDVTFWPPKPITQFNGLIDESEADITLYQEDTGDRRYIRVNRVSGQISVLEQL